MWTISQSSVHRILVRSTLTCPSRLGYTVNMTFKRGSFWNYCHRTAHKTSARHRWRERGGCSLCDLCLRSREERCEGQKERKRAERELERERGRAGRGHRAATSAHTSGCCCHGYTSPHILYLYWRAHTQTPRARLARPVFPLLTHAHAQTHMNRERGTNKRKWRWRDK